MFLRHLSVINYKNLKQVELDFSPKINCFFGNNGMGKTNLLDAIYFLSFCKSHTNLIDSQNVHHEEEFFVIQGFYDNGEQTDEIYCGCKRKQKKSFKRNKKAYERFSDHIGLIPLVMISPADSELIQGGSEERRKFMDMVISQFDKTYLDALIRYNKALQQRNTMLKQPDVDETLFDVWEEQMALFGQLVFEKRSQFVQAFIPEFQHYYERISQQRETVSLQYVSHLQQGDLLPMLKEAREKDRIIGFSRKGVHKDDLNMQLDNFPIRRIGSQGQNKTYLIALKLAQFNFLKKASNKIPLLLMDDIFDKLDASRVEQVVRLVSENEFEQIFITDTNREHLHDILKQMNHDFRVFYADNGSITNQPEL